MARKVVESNGFNRLVHPVLQVISNGLKCDMRLIASLLTLWSYCHYVYDILVIQIDCFMHKALGCAEYDA